jgi:hypothetical protein
MVVYGLALGNQRQLNGGDFSTWTDELWPGTAGRWSIPGVRFRSTLWRHFGDWTEFQLAVIPEPRLFKLLTQISWRFPIPHSCRILLANASFLIIGQPV